MTGVEDLIRLMEGLYRNQIYGWTKNLRLLNNSFEVEVFLNRRLVSTVIAYRPRTDFKSASSANTHYGFLLDNLDPEILDLAEIEVRSSEKKEASAIQGTASALEGVVEKIQLDELSSWVWHVGRPIQSAKIDVFHQGSAPTKPKVGVALTTNAIQ